jgi:predicted NBD/HSP70 family sugar kinase
MSNRGNRKRSVSKSEEIIAVLASLHEEAVRTLAVASSASPTLAGIMLRSLGPGTIKVLEVHGVIDGEASRRGRGISLTPFGREVLSSVADMPQGRYELEDVTAAQMRLDDAYARFLNGAESEQRPLAVAIDIGHYDIRVALGNRDGELLAEAHEHASVDKERRSTLVSAVRMAKSLLESTKTPPEDIACIGMGIPGPVDERTGRIMVSAGSFPYLLDWGNAPVRIDEETRMLIAQEFGRPVDVKLGNDANLCVLGEVKYGAGAGLDHVIFLKLSAGIGAGLYLQGSLYRGANGYAGEFGHTPVADYPDREDPKLEVCDRCGRCCLEAVASGMSLERTLGRTMASGGYLSLTDVLERAEEVPAFKHAVACAGQYIGIALSGLILNLDPQVVLLGGALTRAGDSIIHPIKHEVAERVGTANQVVLAEHREDAAVYGALDMAFTSTETQHAKAL